MKKIIYALCITCLFLLNTCDANKDVILDSEWIASSIKFENGDITTPDAEYILIFENKRQYRLQLDVNLCGGEAFFKGKSVRFNNGMACTEACCDSPFAIALVEHLTKTRNWQLNGNELVFSDDKRMEIVFAKK